MFETLNLTLSDQTIDELCALIAEAEGSDIICDKGCREWR